MAKKIPPRPGGSPPRPGARPRPGAPARPPAPPRPEPSSDARRPTRPDVTASPVERKAAPPPAADALEMVPLGDGPVEETDAAPSSATSFFAVPQPKRKKAEEPPPAPAPAPEVPAAAPAAPPPPVVGIQGPVASGPVAQGPLVSGPVAQGPVAQGPVGYGVGGPVAAPHDGGRARSYRVFAVITGLIFLVFTATLLAVGLMAWGVWSAEEKNAQASGALVPAPPPPAAPARAARDTGGPERPAPPPEPKPRPAAPSAPSTPSAPKPPPKPATGPAPATIQIPPDQPFTSIEVTCPSGYRARATFEGGRATLRDVPREDCTVHFKGGPPARNRISGGQTKTCTFPNAQAVCQ